MKRVALFLRAHVQGYIRKDGATVSPYERGLNRPVTTGAVPLLAARDWRGEAAFHLPVEVAINRERAGQIDLLPGGHVRIHTPFHGLGPGLDADARQTIQQKIMAETGPKSDGTFWRMTNNTKEPRLAAAGQLRRSRNHADGFDEKGVSVADGAHYTMAGYTHGYRVTGEVVGLGSDGEPLLDPKTIRVLSKIMASDNIDAEQRVVDRAAEDAALTLMDWTRTHYRAAMTHLVGMSVEEFARHRAGGGGQRPAS